MTKRKTRARRFAICIDNSEYPVSLEVHKMYRLVPDPEAEADGDLRVIDESGEDYLYPAQYFILLHLPEDTRKALSKSFAGAVSRID